MMRRAVEGTWTTWESSLEELSGLEVVVLYGGIGGEREVSLTSGGAVLAALADAPLGRVIGVEIQADGSWLFGGRSLPAPEAVAALPADALYFLGLHGSPGEDGRMQAFLELCGKRYTGSGPIASGVGMDKRRSREAAAAVGTRVAPGVLVSREEFASEPDRAVNGILALGDGPFFCKPNCGGSSVGVTRAQTESELRAGIARALEEEPDVLVELGQAGVEVTAGFIGNRGEELTALPLVEIQPRSGSFFDYEEKYDAQGAVELCPPESLDSATCERVQERAAACYRALGIEGYARIDWLVEPGGEPVFLEANTLPGFTPRSILPRAAAETGVSFEALCLELITRALKRTPRS